MAQNDVYKEFLTVTFEYWNHFRNRLSEKSIRMYSEEGKGKNRKEYLPPTIYDVYFQINGVPLFAKDLERTLPDFDIAEPSEEIRTLKAADIARQDEIMRVVKLRHENFHYDCGLIKAGTWVGKSIVAVKLAKYFRCRTLVLVTNAKLLGEMRQRFKDFAGIDAGTYGGGKKEIRPVTICTKKSFSLDYEAIQSAGQFGTVIVDECHQGFSDALRLGINKSFRSVNFFWMSSTPFTPELDQEDLEKYFGKAIDVKDGYDYTPDFEIIDYKPGKVRIRGEEKSEYVFEDYAELRGMMAEDEIRFEHQFDKLKRLYAERNAIIVLTDRVYESNAFYDRMAKGDTSRFNLIKITGETDEKDDSNAVSEALANGKKTVIVGSIQKIGTGFDFPPADTVLLVSAIKWKSTTEQAIGRILRKHKDKLNPLVVIWNDEALRGQRAEKINTIKHVYWVDKEGISFSKAGDHRMPHEKITLQFTDITKKP